MSGCFCADTEGPPVSLGAVMRQLLLVLTVSLLRLEKNNCGLHPLVAIIVGIEGLFLKKSQL